MATSKRHTQASQKPAARAARPTAAAAARKAPAAKKGAPVKATMARRSQDGPKRAGTAKGKAPDKAADKAPNQPQRTARRGGRLRSEVVIPVGIGAMVMCAGLGLIGSAAKQLGAGLLPVL